ncbi:hypothetical protein GCM10009087_33130 [Sphingomonas oligophenolica]
MGTEVRRRIRGPVSKDKPRATTVLRYALSIRRSRGYPYLTLGRFPLVTLTLPTASRRAPSLSRREREKQRSGDMRDRRSATRVAPLPAPPHTACFVRQLSA